MRPAAGERKAALLLGGKRKPKLDAFEVWSGLESPGAAGQTRFPPPPPLLDNAPGAKMPYHCLASQTDLCWPRKDFIRFPPSVFPKEPLIFLLITAIRACEVFFFSGRREKRRGKERFLACPLFSTVERDGDRDKTNGFLSEARVCGASSPFESQGFPFLSPAM